MLSRTMLSAARARPPLATRTVGLRLSHSYTREPFKILFCGSDEFSAEALRALLDAEDTWQSIVVLTPRERRVGRRGSELYFPPLKTFAIDRGLTTADIPETGLRDGYTFPKPFTAHHPAHLLLTASFGHIIPTPLLSPFAHALNVHPSVLPKYRGAAPIQWAIANGDKSTGVTVQTVGAREVGVDSGAILGAVDGLPIPPDATYTNLLPTLSHVGGKALVAVLRQLLSGTASPRPQDGPPTRAPKITTATAHVDWGLPAALIEARHRGFGHHSPLWTTVPITGREGREAQIQLLAVGRPAETPDVLRSFPEPAPGTAVLDKKGKRVLVAGKDAWIEVTRVKPAGRAEMGAAEWWNGLPHGQRKAGWIMFV